MSPELELLLKEKKLETIASMMRWEKYKTLKDEIFKLTSSCNFNEKTKISERLFCILNKMTSLPLCACGNICRFKTFGDGYSEYCSKKCGDKFCVEQRQKTMIKNYGHAHALQCKSFIEKAKKTSLENYGVDNIFKNVAFIKEKFNEKYGVDNPFKLESVKEKSKITNIEKYGFEYASQAEEVKEKSKQSCLKKYDVEYSFQSENNKEKSKQTKLERYGKITYNNPEKYKKTMNEKYGFDNSLQVPHIRDKVKETMKTLYGYEHALQVDAFRTTFKNTMIENHGVEYSSQSPILREKTKKTWIKNYGVEHIMQNADLHEKQQKHRWKDYIMPSGKTVKIQGYEHFALDELLKTYSEDEIIISRKDMPEFWYEFDGKKRRYFPDIFIQKDNLVLEVKSSYTLNLDLEKNLAKQQSVISSGYNFEFKIY